MEINDRIAAFVKLGEIFAQINSYPTDNDDTINKLREVSNKQFLTNPWFTPEFTRHAIEGLGKAMTEEKMVEWLSRYIDRIPSSPKTVAVVMAGNIPLVGFHDFLCVLISGHKVIAKLSDDDKTLFPVVCEILCEIAPDFRQQIQLTTTPIKGFDAVIATGSNNTARYFDYYFGKYPNIIRKSRTSVAILDGNESETELRNLAHDVFLYFGLGCRNVSKVFVPEEYDFAPLIEACSDYQELIHNHKYANNLDYQKSILLVNRESFLDGGHLLIKPDEGYHSPISVLFYEKYSDQPSLQSKLKEQEGQLQCIIGKNDDQIGFGAAQYPELWNYADGVDTMEFLVSLES